MSIYTLTGRGVQALTAGTTALHVHVDRIPIVAGIGQAYPSNYYDTALLRLGDGTAWWKAVPVEALDAWIGLFNGVTHFAYACLNNSQITVTEVIGGSFPFQGPEGPAGPAGPVGPAGAPGAAGAGVVVLSEQTLGATAASLDAAALVQTYTHLYVDAWLRSDNTQFPAVQVRARLNGDSSAAYQDADVSRIGATTAGTSTTSAQTFMTTGQCPAGTALADYWGILHFELLFYRLAHYKALLYRLASPPTSGNNPSSWHGGAFYISTSAINEVTLFPQLGSWVAGSRMIVSAL